DYFMEYIPRQFGMEVVMGTHPVPEKYNLVHQDLGTWPGMVAQDDLKILMADKKTRLDYD
ncbi:MAG: CGGC domain-containing protein, partial [Candidatus Krumholzibacteria bacterium]|nr:CGGC domain-containing protein [Candidatus Krumholzibacteria bacterium]